MASRFADESDPLLEAVQGIARQLVAITTSALLRVERSGRRRVTLPEYRILVLVSLGRVEAPSDLADELQVTRPAVAQILGRLVAKGFIRRSSHGDDGRRSRLSITPAGRSVVDAVMRERARTLRPALRRLTTRERAELLRSLERFGRTLGPKYPTRVREIG